LAVLPIFIKLQLIWMGLHKVQNSKYLNYLRSKYKINK
jgi:hypothetical protein